MNDRLRVIRDQISKGDDVLVLNHGPKPRLARVVEVLRSAVRVRYADAPGLDHTVMLKQVQRVEESAPLTRASSTRVKPTPKLEVSVDPPPPAAPPKLLDPPPPAAPPSDLDAWLDMGREVSSRVDAELAELEAQAGALVADMQTLRAAFDEIERRKLELRAQKTRIETVLKP